MHVTRLEADDVRSALPGLGGLLVDSVEGGASVGFLDTVTTAEAQAWWAGVLDDPDSLTWVARDGDDIVGSVRLLLVTMPNGLHRAEVSKVLVRRSHRGRGLARQLMEAAETEARRLGRSLLVLDTQTGSDAEGIYAHLGWTRLGEIPDYAGAPDGTLVGTTIMFKRLAG
ncbi:acetyltransferase [Intrasporangium oryzae NRRL B-24470]|uniref:Acetyltransferase n=1 Tax=Intrasporangium oryzae NRRL B-24470 TaxID=1386089 RepID=W9G767_9MICO|nr:GNAT family N-acetyltransferase [Intrasporangium oryzae]EWS99723.1 acetyltransferase [Intrasporangium oryzae NRRL B-24470]